MATVTRFYSEFKDRKGLNWRVEFCDKDYTGTEYELKLGAEAFTINWAGNANEPHQPIVTSSAEFYLIIETAAAYDWLLEMPNAAPDRFTVAVKYLSGVSYELRWAGVVMIDGVSIEDIYLPQQVTLQANDDLSRLQDVLYKTSETVEYSGTAFIHEHLRNCFLKLRTAHHWEDSDVLLRIVPYLRPAADTGDGVQLTKLRHEFLHNANSDGVKQYLSAWQVLEEIALLYGARIFLDGGKFDFQPLAAFTRDAESKKLLGVEHYTKGGTIFSGVDITNYSDFDTEIERLRGWRTDFLPRLKTVERTYNSGGTQLAGWVWQYPEIPIPSTGTGAWLAHSWTGAQSGQITLMTPNSGAAYILTDRTPRFGLIYHVDSDTGTPALTGNDKAIRYRVEVKIKFEGIGGGTNYYVQRTATHDTTNTAPVLLADGTLAEVSGVTYSAATYTTTSTDTCDFITTAVDGTLQYLIDEYLEVNLPVTNQMSVVSIGVAAYAIDSAGVDDNTIHADVDYQTTNGLTLFYDHGEIVGADKYRYYASAAAGREVLTLPTAILGDATSETAVNYLEFGSGATTYWETLDDTTEQRVHQHVVREILAYRAQAMEVRSGTLRPIVLNNFGGKFYFGTSLVIDNTITPPAYDKLIYVPLSMDWAAARAEYTVQAGLFRRAVADIDEEDEDIPVLGAPPPEDGGAVEMSTLPQQLNTGSQQNFNNTIGAVLRQSMRQAERTKLGYITNTAAVNLDTAITVLNRIVGDYTADAGSLKAITPIGATTPPRIDIYKANDDTVTQATVKVTIAVSTALGSSYTFTLPKTLPTTGSELLAIGTSGTVKKVTDGSSGEFLTTNGAGVLSWAAASGGSSSDGWHGSTTLLKVMPTEFFMNDDYTRAPLAVEDDTTDYLGIRCPANSVELYAFVAIPTGYKATDVQVYASASTSSAVTAYSFNHTSGAIVSKGSGDFNSAIDITDVTSGSTTSVAIKLAPASNLTVIYGADITLAAV